MGTLWVADNDFTLADGHSSFAADEMTIDGWRVAAFEATKLLREHAVQSVGDHRHDDVEVDLDEDGRRQRVEMEELDGFGDTILDSPSSCVMSHDVLNRSIQIVRDEE